MTRSKKPSESNRGDVAEEFTLEIFKQHSNKGLFIAFKAALSMGEERHAAFCGGILLEKSTKNNGILFQIRISFHLATDDISRQSCEGSEKGNGKKRGIS